MLCNTPPSPNRGRLAAAPERLGGPLVGQAVPAAGRVQTAAAGIPTPARTRPDRGLRAQPHLLLRHPAALGLRSPPFQGRSIFLNIYLSVSVCVSARLFF